MNIVITNDTELARPHLMPESGYQPDAAEDGPCFIAVINRNPHAITPEISLPDGTRLQPQLEAHEVKFIPG